MYEYDTTPTKNALKLIWNVLLEYTLKRGTFQRLLNIIMKSPLL